MPYVRLLISISQISRNVPSNNALLMGQMNERGRRVNIPNDAFAGDVAEGAEQIQS